MYRKLIEILDGVNVQIENETTNQPSTGKKGVMNKTLN